MDKSVLSEIFDELWPICRSITGPGIRESLNVLSKYIPLEINSIPSGTKVFDWEVPPEWSINNAYIEGPDGKKYAEFSKSNLHVLNFSTPIDKKMPLEELKKNIHSIKELPNAVPYVTSYYQRNWGFCLDDETLRSLPDGEYHAYIDSTIKPGELNFGELVIEGESKQEIFLSTYLCHPSLANNELSGPLVMLGLYDLLKKRKPKFTYRFYIGPETIGSLSYLHLRGEHLRKHMFGGFVLTCLGGPQKQLSLKKSRLENSTLNKLGICLSQEKNSPFNMREFTPVSGSDERQFCSPGFNLPLGQFSKTVYGQYDGYHNSLDTKDFMDLDSIKDSVEKIDSYLQLFEYCKPYENLSPFGEVQLGKRGLYPNMNSRDTWETSSDEVIDGRSQLDVILNLLNYCDGEHSIIEIAQLSDLPLKYFPSQIEKLINEGLLKVGQS